MFSQMKEKVLKREGKGNTFVYSSNYLCYIYSIYDRIRNLPGVLRDFDHLFCGSMNRMFDAHTQINILY